ncbi:cysteine--tRNA ligase [Pseudolysobacter antarcticus]|uniref:Cysteine--tRNA ligase n=1 Tax=Pseudolysobacter antarcticus TaxID=2511995 RepID=A0A411HIB5_9GAMM|nr:cysteine--tRNA ligase [Pseudolysobacter antarcticus]QBB70256.1 cysteine--tRNA ligase [Pseudolysobacter antarcticus]
MKLKLHNSLTRRIEEFTPQNPERVTMYLCGPTVYNYVHIGNARPAVVFDLLARLLRRQYPQVVYARNITDVDDKINIAATEQGVPIGTITAKFAQAYREDMAALGVAPPDIEPHATEHIPQMIAMCERLIADGHAYAAENHVLFSVDSYPAYGQLSGRSTEDMIAGARVEVAPYKKSPGDFVLWKPSTLDLPGWDSPWGRGRPGWHIECSAMCEAHLGDTIDIHAGGIDLQFPHHENEIAQSTCAHGGKIFAKYWLHNGMLNMDGRKMSKSLGNVLQLHELLKLHPPELLRFLLLRAQYRQPADWSESALKQARATLDGWYGALRDLLDVPVDPRDEVVPTDFEAALCDDLNTPEAFAILSRLVDDTRKAATPEQRTSAKAKLLGAAHLLGLLTLHLDPQAWFQQNAAGDESDVAQIEQLVAARQSAKQAKDFALADSLRAQLLALGVVVEDSAQGPRWKRVSIDELA